MSRHVKDEIRHKGTAGIMVVLDEQRTASVDRLRECFGTSPHQTPAPRGKAAAMLHLRNLGVVYGHVNQRGWAKLQQELSGSDAVSGSQTLRPIRGMKPRPDVATAPEVSWGLERIGAPALWKQGLTGQGVLAGHLDTGVDGGHPALAGAIHEYAEFDATGNRVPGASVTDSGDHGTHTAGIIAGRRVGNRAIGVAPGCQLVSGMIMEGGDVLARVLGGVDWMLQFPVKVLNLSLGFPGYFDEYVPLLNRIRQRGILPVFAVGNEGPGSSRSPGNYANCVSVGAIDERGDVDPNSSSERFRRRSNPLVPDLVLPGVDIVSANATGGFRSDSGTSMAAPHVSGLAALLWQAVPAATVDQVEAAIFDSCRRPVAADKARVNRGVPDAVRALASLLESQKASSVSAAGLSG